MPGQEVRESGSELCQTSGQVICPIWQLADALDLRHCNAQEECTSGACKTAGARFQTEKQFAAIQSELSIFSLVPQ